MAGPRKSSAIYTRSGAHRQGAIERTPLRWDSPPTISLARRRNSGSARRKSRRIRMEHLSMHT